MAVEWVSSQGARLIWEVEEGIASAKGEEFIVENMTRDDSTWSNYWVVKIIGGNNC